MKAKKLYEFKQGQNPYNTMEIGSTRPIKEGDKIKLTEAFFYFFNSSSRKWVTRSNWKKNYVSNSIDTVHSLAKESIYTITDTVHPNTTWIQNESDNHDVTWFETEWLKDQFILGTIKRL
jgi:hypothetical protein